VARTATERTAAEQHTFSTRVEWLRAQADTIAEVEPNLAATRGALPSVVLDSTLEQIARGRERLEHAAADLVAGGRSLRRRHIAAERPGSADELYALLTDVATGLPKRHATRCRTELPKANASEVTILTDLVDEGLTHEQLLHLLEGGHLLVPGLDLIDGWSVLDGVTPRTSSHYHPHDEAPPGPRWIEKARTRLADAKAKPMYGQQYGMKGRFVHEVLFGPGPQVTTFVQLERAAPSKLRLAEHIGDWVEYRVTRRNQGPYGSTVETDANPMRARPVSRPDDTAAAVAEAVRIGEVLATVAREIADEAPLAIVVRRGPDVDETDEAVSGAVPILLEASGTLTGLAGADGDAAP